MTSKSSSRVDQKRLAREIGVTDRRIRQLVDEYILPPAHHTDGTYDLDLCRDRYDLYRDGSDRDWTGFYEEADREVTAARKAIDRAFADDATTAHVTAASMALQASMSTVRFVTACRSKSDAEREFLFPIFQREEDDAIRNLLGRGMQILGAAQIVDDETGEVIATCLSHIDLKAPITKTAARKRRPTVA